MRSPLRQEPKPLTLDEIKLMEVAGSITAEVLRMLEGYVKPGKTTSELNKIAEDYILSKNAVPTFKGYLGYPFTLCTSVDECVVHGFPNDVPLVEGQILSIDCGSTYQGFVGDSAVTYAVGDVSEEKKKLMKVTEESL